MLHHKKSFSLFETLISLIILSMIMGGFTAILTTNMSYQTYKDLQLVENKFYLDGTIIQNENIQFFKY
ncbi:hypothetical protein MNB_ARC-1_1090 [hydrothermal vent metagenome]|uniref:Uncharacterized protein n=1 Tax=hydrothermal vent metagenome TaxID=652676 RepID=A0A3B1DWU3_9ZZZZ